MNLSRQLKLRTIIPLIAWSLFLSASSVFGLSGEVRDDAQFFSASAIQRANNVIHDIKQRFHKDLFIETVKTVPADKLSEAKSSDPEVRRRFFSEWARSRARDARVNGVYVLITRNPGHLEVAVGDKTIQSGEFPSDARTKLKDLLVDNFRKRDYDNGLIAATELVRGTLAQTSPKRASGGRVTHSAPVSTGEGSAHPAQSSSSSSPLLKWVFILIAVLVGVWIFRAIAGALSRRAVPGGGMSGAPGAGPMGMGGGGFMSGLLGGLFGAVAGSWLYDSFFRGSSAASHMESGDYGTRPGMGEAGQEDVDYSTSGSDFDTGNTGGSDFDSGGDFGSGDFGGGDFGGGDFGG